jgi:hypothetical protein
LASRSSSAQHHLPVGEQVEQRGRGESRFEAVLARLERGVEAAQPAVQHQQVGRVDEAAGREVVGELAQPRATR